MKKTKSAIVIGATGLVGKELVKQLLNDSDLETIKVMVRRSTGISHPKIKEYIIDFNNLNSIKEEVTGDVLFSTLGTTIKQAGSKEQQYLVDYTYQYDIAKIAFANGVSDYFLVSSSGANSGSKIFYTRMKGELDDAVATLNFSRIRIFRPSLLLGERPKKRLGETIGSIMIAWIKHIPYLKKYRGIRGEQVAKAMIAAHKKEKSEKVQIYTLDEIFNLI